MNTTDVKVSLIVPVFNVAQYLRAGLDSFLCQTMTQIEIICINDGSTDDSGSILREYAKKDSRIRILEQENSGTVIARNRGVAASHGEYVMFVDPDDELKPTACEKVYQEAVRRHADILQYGVEFIEMFNRTASQIASSESYFNSAPEECFGDDILTAVYRDNTMAWNLIFRAVRGDLARAAFADIPDIRSINETDTFAFFYVAVRARSFFFIKDKLYVYRYGTGVSTKKIYGLPEYEKTLGKIPCAYALIEYAQQKWQSRPDVSFCARVTALRMISNSWVSAISRVGGDETQLAAVQALMKRVKRSDLIAAWANKYGESYESLVNKLAQMEIIPRRVQRKICRVGFYYHRMSHGGVQRVISLLIPVFQHLNITVTLFLDEEITENSYSVSQGVEVVYLPNPLKNIVAWQRVEGLCKALTEHPVDLFYSHAHVSPMAFWDMLVCKFAFNIPYVIHQHNVFTCLLNGSEIRSYQRFFEIPGFHRFCDFVITLSRVDSEYERLNGVSAVYLPNPVSEELRCALDSKPKERKKHHVLWLARLSWEKHPGDAIQVFRHVKKAIPDATMSMVGGGDPKIEEYLKKMIRELGLESCVQIVGAINDVVSEYMRSSVYLSTSAFEGFPMTSLEAMSCGLPIIAYELPYLELYRDNNAVIQVPQGNATAAAAAIIRVFSLPSMLDLRNVAQKFVRGFSNFDFYGAWKNLILAVENGADIGDGETCGSTELMLDTFRKSAYGLMMKMSKHGDEMKALQIKLSVSNKRRAELWAEREQYRTGLAASDKRRAELWAEVEKRGEELKKLRGELGASQARRAELYHEVELKSAALKELQAKLAASDKRRAEVWAEREQYRTGLVASDKRRAELWAEVEKRGEELKKLRGELGASQTRRAELYHEVELKSAALKNASAQIGEAEKLCARIEKEKSMIESKRQILAAELHDQTSKCLRAQAEVASLKGSFAYRTGMVVTWIPRKLAKIIRKK